MEESEIGLKLRLDDGSMNLPLKDLICQVEDVVRAVIGGRSTSRSSITSSGV